MGQTIQPGPMFLQPRSPGQIVSQLLKQVTVILNPVVKAAPALIDPLYVMAQVKYLSGEPVRLNTLPRASIHRPPAWDVSQAYIHTHLWSPLP